MPADSVYRASLTSEDLTDAVLVGCVYVAYGLGVQVSPSVEPLSVAALAGFPVLVVAVALVVVRHHVRAVLPERSTETADGRRATPALSVGERLDALKRCISGFTGRFR